MYDDNAEREINASGTKEISTDWLQVINYFRFIPSTFPLYGVLVF